MNFLFKCIICDIKKTKKLYFHTLHFIIAILSPIIFLLYYSYVNWDNESKLLGYFQILGMGFPILISLFSVMLIEQELNAASFQNMLSILKRLPLFYSKLILLIVNGTFSIFLASIIFGLGNIYIIKQSPINISFYLLFGFILISTNILLYIFHLFLSLRFNKGVSIIIGIIESLINALLVTGLGENIWYYVPSAYASRLISHIIKNVFDTKCIFSIFSCIILTIFSIILFSFWAYNWEGQHSSD